jgi:hypothetical protein
MFLHMPVPDDQCVLTSRTRCQASVSIEDLADHQRFLDNT